MPEPHKCWSCSRAHLSPQSVYLHGKIIIILVSISRLFTCLMKFDDPILGKGWWDEGRRKNVETLFTEGITTCHPQIVYFGIGVSNSQPMSCLQPRMAMSAAQHKIKNLLKTFFLLISFC